MVEFHDKKFLAKKVRAAKITVDNPKNLGSARRGVRMLMILKMSMKLT